MLADGGDCLADLRAVGDQPALFGATASPSTAFRVIDRIATTPGLLEGLREAHALARGRVWELAGAPDRVTIDLERDVDHRAFGERRGGGHVQGWVRVRADAGLCR
jgi:hypothetical protein